ncbi:phage portal protein [Candidatus Fermentibacteria bacterium]|nr:MAG: phage portal protein [Candidatus Fermentibacteria bacterium]
MDIRKFLSSAGKKLSARINAKKYVGILHGGVPVNSRTWGSTDFMKAYDISLYTNRAISKRADKVGEIEFLLQDKKGDEIKDDPIFALLNKPNKVFTGPQFWSLYQKYMDLVGEAYIYMRSESEIFEPKRVTEIHLLMPTAVTHQKNKETGELEFKYSTGNTTVTYSQDEIIYVRNPDPKNPLRGQSILQAGINAIQTEIQISTYHSRILENGGKMEGVFKFKTPNLTEDQLTQMKDRYQKEYGAAKKAGVPMFLGGDADYVNLGLSPTELSYLEAKKMTFQDLAILTGVPKSILATTDDVKFDNADASKAIFLSETILPLLKTLTISLDNKLFPDDRTLTFVDPTPENVEQILKQVESGIKNYYMTPNEARAVRGLDPVDGGDDILVPFNLMPLGEEEETNTEKSIKKKEINHPLKDEGVRRLYWNMQIKRMTKREKLFTRELNKYFKEQSKRIVETLQPKKTKRFRKKGLVDEVFDLELEITIGKEKFIPIITELLKDAGVDALELTGSEFAFNVTSDMSSWIDSRSAIFMRSINETTLKKLKKEFAESLVAEEGREALIGRIQTTYTGIKKSRAALIARTEVHNATQFGTMEGYKQGGVTTKIWVAVLDSATRDTHAQVDGEEKPLDMAFSNGLLFPGDPTGPPEEVINCRCVI